ncbi:hypothetical protein WR25_05136 [Diploscapter pachys]|uniref:Uncharacterized protein n=1 Tax=Diploscapter pachys TaxID=2018661 RepID=A0A2A2JIA3_9BILA|nr:hypothetical protein WR25_05136 [Diploscapter pachys]
MIFSPLPDRVPNAKSVIWNFEQLWLLLVSGTATLRQELLTNLGQVVDLLRFTTSLLQHRCCSSARVTNKLPTMEAMVVVGWIGMSGMDDWYCRFEMVEMMVAQVRVGGDISAMWCRKV